MLLDGHSWGAIARLGRLCERDSGVGVLHWRAVYRRGVVCLWVFLERAFLIWLALSIWCSHFRWLALFFYPLASSASRATVSSVPQGRNRDSETRVEQLQPMWSGVRPPSQCSRCGTRRPNSSARRPGFGLAMIFKLAEAAEKSWRRLNGHNQLPKIILGIKFTDGIEVVRSQTQIAAA